VALFHIIMLALIQGLSEFLPISSSAHLVLPSQLLGWPDQGLAFDVAVHVGTLIAVIIYFRRDIYQLIDGWLKQVIHKQASTEANTAWFIVVATIPACVFGLLVNDFVESHLRSLQVIAATTLIFGVVLWWADHYGKKLEGLASLSWGKAIFIGLAQAVALIPGTSRSGITITAGLMLGLTRDAAARFSFLMSIPIILAAGSLKTLDLIKQESAVDWLSIGTGAVISGVSAYLCIHLFLKLLDRVGMTPFVLYRLFLGVLLIGVIFYQ